MGNLTIKPASGGLLKLQDAGSTDRIQITDGGSTILYDEGGDAALTIETDGKATFAENIKISANKGIDFSAAQTSATEAETGTTDSETLDSYEEGEWTITSEHASVSNPSTVRTRLYTKIGRLVTVAIEFVVPSNSQGSQATFGGLPFNSSDWNTYRDSGSVEGYSSATNSYIINSVDQFLVYGTGFSALNFSDLSGQTIVVKLTYMTAT